MWWWVEVASIIIIISSSRRTYLGSCLHVLLLAGRTESPALLNDADALAGKMHSVFGGSGVAP